MIRKFKKFESSSRLNAMKFSFDIDLPKSNDIISLFLNISNIAGTINENKIRDISSPTNARTKGDASESSSPSAEIPESNHAQQIGYPTCTAIGINPTHDHTAIQSTPLPKRAKDSVTPATPQSIDALYAAWTRKQTPPYTFGKTSPQSRFASLATGPSIWSPSNPSEP